MDGRFNTIAGWVLGAGIVFLGANLVTHEIFKAASGPTKMGYPINGVEEEGHGAAAAERPIAFYLQTADAARGERHLPPNAPAATPSTRAAPTGSARTCGARWARPSAPAMRGFAFSDALRNHGGRWDWDTMNAWLTSPRDFAPGTRMTFNGLSVAQERADVMLFLNQHGGNLTVPPPPAAEPAAGNEAAGNEAGANASAGQHRRGQCGRARGQCRGAGRAGPRRALSGSRTS